MNNTSTQQNWPNPDNYRKSIQNRFIVICGIVLLLSIGVTGVVLTNKHTEEITQATVTALQVQARTAADMAAQLIIGTEVPDGALLTDICQSLVTDNPSIYWVGISDTTGTYIAHTDIRQVVTQAKVPVLSSESISGALADLAGNYESSSDTFIVKVPVVNRGFEVGALTLAASSKPIQQARVESIRTIGIVTLLIMFVGLVIQVLLARRMLRPIRVITDSIRRHTDISTKLEIPVTTTDELGYLAASLTAMDEQLRDAQRTRSENERIAKELEFARELQASILPEFWPNSAHYAFSGVYRSARETGGDYYDFIQLDDHRLAFLVADVAGKSLPGMLVMLLTREAIRKAGRRLERPRELLIYVNEELRGKIKSGTFVTMFYGILDTQSARLTFCSAGHNALIHISQNESEPKILKTTGLPLGVFPSQTFNQHLKENTCMLSAGDFLVQYTDGINEARNASGEELGLERFLRILSRYKEETVTSLVQKVMADHTRFVGETEQYDDITLLALKWGNAIQTVTIDPDQEEYVEVEAKGY